MWPFLFFLLYLFLMLVVLIWVKICHQATLGSLYMFSLSSMICLLHKKKKKVVMSFFVSSLCNNFGHPIVYIYSICIWRLNYRFYPYLWHFFVTHTYDHISRSKFYPYLYRSYPWFLLIYWVIIHQHCLFYFWPLHDSFVHLILFQSFTFHLFI